MIKHKINGFTLLELIIAVSIIWILFMATTVYLWWTDEKRKVIEAQWCASSLWWEITNYVFYALTSKNLKLSNWKMDVPNNYYIQLTWWTSNCPSWSFCGITLSYSSWTAQTPTAEYKTLTTRNTCRWSNTRLTFTRTWDSNYHYVKMNKWFSESPENPNDNRVFWLDWGYLKWYIIISLCLNSECSSPRQISRFVIDWSTQTIALKNCKYYENDPNICKTRDDCKVYDATDKSRCTEY